MKSNSVQEPCEDQLSDISRRRPTPSRPTPARRPLSTAHHLRRRHHRQQRRRQRRKPRRRRPRRSRRVFTCNYCQRKFFCSKALGGHQNAHRRELTLARCASCTSSAMPTWPPSRSSLYPIGIRTHVSVHHPGVAVPAPAKQQSSKTRRVRCWAPCRSSWTPTRRPAL